MMMMTVAKFNKIIFIYLKFIIFCLKLCR